MKTIELINLTLNEIRRSAQIIADVTAECSMAINHQSSETVAGLMETSIKENNAERGIKCHPLYYDEQGNFHVERRLGCIGCPLASQKQRIEQFKQYPKMLKLWIKSQQKFLEVHPNSKSFKHNDGNAYNCLFRELFCKTFSDYQNLITGGLFPETAIDAKSFMEDYFKIDLTI